MNIFVCVKQVPDTAEISINPETGTLNRAGVESVMNPLDGNALEEALRLREHRGAKVTAVTMGPKQAETVLREALAMGADEAVLCSDKRFAGADTWATACTLAACAGVLKEPDLILCGKQAIDGDTAQVPAELSVMLDYPFIPYVSEIISLEGKTLRVKSMTDNGFALLETPLPAVCSVVKAINVPRLTSLAGWLRGFNTTIHHITAKDLPANDIVLGLKGSPTRVKKITPVSHTKKVRYLDAENPEDLQTVCRLLEKARVEEGTEQNTNNEGAGKENFETVTWKACTAAEMGEYRDLQNRVCVLGETDPFTNRLHTVSYELLGEGKRLADIRRTEVVFVVPMNSEQEATMLPIEDLQRVASFSIRKIVCITTGVQNGFEANRYAEAVAAACGILLPEIILAPATLEGRAYVPLVASRLKTGLTADCTHFDIDKKTNLLRQTRPAFGGNIMATIITPEHKPQMATVRPHVLRSPSQAGNVTLADLELFHFVNKKGASRKVSVLEYTNTVSNTEDISNASLIISGGRGVGGNKDNENSGFPLLAKAAAAFGGSVGASRSAVEAGWAPYHQQVGQTGKTVQPKLYIACGISGAVQHLVGMHDSETIIAVNKDLESPIFKAADYGFIDDYNRVVTKLLQYCSKGRKGTDHG